MNAGVYAKVSATMFKKGHMPDNTLYDGAETIRKDKNGHRYVYVRISLGKWVPKHVLLWQQECCFQCFKCSVLYNRKILHT